MAGLLSFRTLILLSTLHTATGVCQTDTAVCLLASSHYLFDSCTYSLERLVMDGWTVRNMYSVWKGYVVKHNSVN